MHGKMIDISVITPFYHGNAYMEQLFGCIRRNAQAAPQLGIELLLINDSPECAIQYQEEWIENFSLKIVENPAHAGIQPSRVTGLHHAGGCFVVFLDQDDLLADTALLSQYKLAQDADIVVSNGYNENRSRKPIYQSGAHQNQVSNMRFYLSVGCQIVSPGQCLIRKSSIPGFWLEKQLGSNGADDYLLWLLMLQEEIRWKTNPDCLYTHINTGENLSADLRSMIQSSEEALNILLNAGKLTKRQARMALRRFAMRRLYEGRKKWRKFAACVCYPDLFWELMRYTCLKNFGQ